MVRSLFAIYYKYSFASCSRFANYYRE